MPTGRFHTLDALRGIAAIAVMLFHAGVNAPVFMPRGYLAADLFFVLSGFVLASSYEARLREGMSLRSFINARLQRIYPVFALGALTGMVLFSGSPLMLLMVPTEYGDGLLFRANAPLWSLLFELIVNIGWALVAVRLSLRMLAFMLTGLAAMLVPAVLSHGGADLGAFWPTALPGLVRTAFSFTMGVILQRLFLRTGRTRFTTPLGWLLLPALVVPLMLASEHRAISDLLMIGVAIPLIVWLGARWNLNAPQLADRLGGLSFPLYCLHAPFVAMATASPSLMTATCSAMIVLALLLDRFFDRPVQSWLKARAQTACPAPLALI